MKHRTLLKFKRTVLGAVNFRTGEVGGKEVRGELNPVKIALEPVAEHLDRAGFGETGRAFDEQVAIGQKTDEQPVDEVLLTDNVFADIVF